MVHTLKPILALTRRRCKDPRPFSWPSDIEDFNSVFISTIKSGITLCQYGNAGMVPETYFVAFRLNVIE